MPTPLHYVLYVFSYVFVLAHSCTGTLRSMFWSRSRSRPGPRLCSLQCPGLGPGLGLGLSLGPGLGLSLGLSLGPGLGLGLGPGLSLGLQV